MSTLSRREEQVLLAIWDLKDSAYLLAIKDHLSRITDDNWSIGIIHKPLLQLERKRYIESRMSAPTAQRGGRRKKIYSVNAEGLEALRILKKEQDLLWENFLRVREA